MVAIACPSPVAVLLKVRETSGVGTDRACPRIGPTDASLHTIRGHSGSVAAGIALLHGSDLSPCFPAQNLMRRTVLARHSREATGRGQHNAIAAAYRHRDRGGSQ